MNEFLVEINTGSFGKVLVGNVQDLLMELCCVAARHAPAYGIGVLLPDMLTIENSGWDALMIGLRALLTMLVAAPAWSHGNQQPNFEVISCLLYNSGGHRAVSWSCHLNQCNRRQLATFKCNLM